MSYIVETEKKVPVIQECDVLVAGGGIAGISAALAAARAGAKVILLEREFALGGLATLGLITIYLPLCDGLGNQVSFGISEELLRLSIRHGVEGRYPKEWLEQQLSPEERKKGQRFMVQYNPHLFAILAEQLLRDAGVTIIYGTVVADVQMKDRKISAVFIENKSGRSAIAVHSVVDATGDADVARAAGAKVEIFKQGNIIAGWYYYTAQGQTKLRQLGASDIPDDQKTEGGGPKPLVSRRFEGLDGIELSEMVQISHDLTLKDILEHRETDETHTPVTMSTIPQIRMTRRIAGLYTLDDKENRQPFADSIGVISDWRKRGPAYEIPFRTLYGAEVDNLIAAGRCISVTDAMWDISRVIPACAVTGEAAGAAAAMTDNFSTLSVEKLQEHLAGQGVKLHID
ncbi:MAG: hypothetical protein K0R57_1613 [Paenibacillaceae bacterium]|jgi:hypothetical protein|nr:hypothetical protein [Paenibacillaceae bacterium]